MLGGKQKIDVRRVFYILNPSGDLARTQAHFQPWLEKNGWKGITGRAPTELEMIAALKNHDLVM
jgi:separase